MGSPRRSWDNPGGKTLSLAGLGVAAAGLLLAVAAAAGWLEGEDTPAAAVYAVYAVSALVLAAGLVVAILPTWSITVGRRGIGLRRLFGVRFVDWGGFNGVEGADAGQLRLVTRRGALKIRPRLPQAAEFARHAASLHRDWQAESTREE